MTTAPVPWPTQLHLPGQVAAPEGPIPMDMMYVMHHAFRRDLNRFVEAVRATPAGDQATWRRLEERWDLFATVLHKHHSGEDAGLWPWLLEHAEPDEVATLEAMEAEHAEIDPLLEACRAGLRRLATTADEDARAALAVRMVAARDCLARHLAHEETDAIGIVQRRMTPEVWARIDAEHFQKETKLGFVAQVVPWAVDGLPREVRERMFGEPGGRVFRLLWLLTRRRYHQRERLAFAHC